MTPRSPHQLAELLVGDSPEAWSGAGFSVVDGSLTIDGVRITLLGDTAARGIESVAIDGLDPAATDANLDGFAIHRCHDPDPPPEPAGGHPNGVTAIDHLVVMTTDCDRTTAALEAVGLEPRRVRTFAIGAAEQRQTFFWLGRVILELVGPDTASGDDPARLWGLALTCADLDATASFLGLRCKPPKPAIQPGRRISTLATRDLGISTAIALMSPH